MKLISWNVNGFRAWQDKPGTLDFIKSKKPDIFCLQEIKASPEQIDIAFFSEYPHIYISSAEKKGYAGTAIFSKKEPLSVSYGIKDPNYNNEGRVITLEFEDYYLVNVYTPNAKPDLARLAYRHQDWDRKFLEHLKNLETDKPVIVCGDFNVAHHDIDLARPDANRTTAKNPGSPGFTDQEREGMTNLLNAGFIDTYRHLFPEKVQYSWWSYRAFARERNVGWRIDYFLISPSLTKKLQSATIHDDITGSDHCPVSIEITI